MKKKRSVAKKNKVDTVHVIYITNKRYKELKNESIRIKSLSGEIIYLMRDRYDY